MPLSSKDAILGVQDIKPPIEFFVPEWNDTVFLRYPTANDRDEWEVHAQENRGKAKSIWRAHLAAILLCDPAGKRIFTSPDDVRSLGEHSAAAVNRIWERGLELMSVTDAEVDELEKN